MRFRWDADSSAAKPEIDLWAAIFRERRFCDPNGSAQTEIRR
jgi:hypothetical protein